MSWLPDNDPVLGDIKSCDALELVIVPRTYIACTNPTYAALEGSRKWVKAQQGWRWAEIATGHDAMMMAPEELARMLIGVTS